MANPAMVTAAFAALTLPLASSGENQVRFKHNFAKNRSLRVFTEKIEVVFKDPAGNLTHLQVKPWVTIKEVKRKLAEMTAPTGFELLIDLDELVSKVMRQRLFFQGKVLADDKSLRDYNVQNGDVIYRLAEEKKGKQPPGLPKVVEPNVQVVLGEAKITAELNSVIDGCREGLSSGLSPRLASSGLGGTYFLRDSKERIVGVFKPEDEEAYAPNNPRGLAGKMGTRGVRNGLLSGEANLREVAAYLLDHEGFAHVPATVRVEVSHHTFGSKPKVGSLQEFKPHDDEAGDVSSSLFTVEGAHRIAIMDMRLLNRDRNDENLLVKRTTGQSPELIPIDHGCSLPDSLEINWHDWAWLSWPQMKKPLGLMEKAYIARLDADVDAAILSRELSIRWQCLLVLRISTLFLQKGAAADLSLYDIASMMSRDESDNPSTLEVVFAQAKTLCESRRRGGNPKRRSPNVSPVAGPIQHGPKLRRSASAVSLDFDAFKLPGIVSGANGSHPADDCASWCLGEDACEEVFDDSFWEYFTSLMDTAVTRRQMKRRAIQQLKDLMQN